MPIFALTCRDKPNSADVRAKARPDHLDHLRSLDAALRAAGPMLDADGGPVGSLVVFEAIDREAAEAFADADPYAAAGLFAERSIDVWNPLLGEWPEADAKADEEE